MAEFGAMKTTKVRVTAFIYAMLIKELVTGASSVKTLQESTGLAKSTLYEYIRELRKAKLVYVSGFDRAANNCPMIPLYEWGPGKKDVKVKPVTVAEKSRIYRRNKRDREIHGRLTLLGQRAGPHAGTQTGGRSAVLQRPDHGGDAVVQCEAGG